VVGGRISIGVAGVVLRLERRCFLGEGVFVLLVRPPDLGLPVWRRLLPCCIMDTRSAASDIDTIEAGRFRLDAEWEAVGRVADAGGLVKGF
jgi:hypothetical protein